MIDQEYQRVMRSSLALGLCAALTACGGGGEGNSTHAAAPSAVLAATPVPLPATTIRAPVAQESEPVASNAGADVSCGLNGAGGIQAELLYRVNALRAAGAVCGSTIYRATGPLNWNSMLLQAASGHSSDMARSNYFSHTSPDGGTMVQRIAATGYSMSAAGENIAAGQSTVEEVMRSWINSPGHCQNLMNPIYEDIGVACVRNDATGYGLYWTMNLGRN